MTTNCIIAYNRFSKSAKALAKATGFRMLSTGKSRDTFDNILCWGYSGALPPGTEKSKILNSPSAISLVSSKSRFFDLINITKPEARCRIPPFTKDAKEAVNWVNEGIQVFGRALTRSHSGKGIVFHDDDIGEFLSCKLFTQHIKNKWEFRVHVFKGEVIDVQRKALRSDVDRDSVDTRIKSHDNGYVFIRRDITVPDDVIKQAKLAINCVPELDFGAVDIVYNQYHDKAYVLEVNTAPGLEGQTIESYAGAIRKAVK